METFVKQNFLSVLKVSWILTISAPIFVLLLFLFRFSPTLQFQILVGAATLYLSSATLHHLKDKSLTLEITIEYVLITALALIILQGLLL